MLNKYEDMTRKEKIEIRKEKAKRRIQKKKDELKAIQSKMWADGITFYQARARVRNNGNGRGFACEMGYWSCEQRGYCNGDC